MKSPCCIPAVSRPAAGSGPATPVTTVVDHRGLVRLAGGSFLMGSESAEAWPQDGEGPVREVILPPFAISGAAVTNAEFLAFAEATGHRTDAERFGWSFVHNSQLEKSTLKKSQPAPGLDSWSAVKGANWRHPFGGSGPAQPDHPAVHISWNDAAAYAAWRGLRLPTEAEWEFAARGGLEQKTYPWGDELLPQGQHRCNIWQGEFPIRDTGADGHRGTAPVRAFEPNAYGLHQMTGNVWEWAADWFHPTSNRPQGHANLKGPPAGRQRVMRGGSYLCHASYCNRYRCSARSANSPDSSAGNLGFRCAADAP